MTHDELLEKIEDRKELSKYAGFSKDQVAAFSALSAVVELHSPMYSASIGGEPIVMCSGCYEEESSHSDYPCPTIQAIEKELTNG